MQVNFAPGILERLEEYADQYFEGDVNAALEYCFEECEPYPPSFDDLSEDDAW
jgi:hypothetical protein